MKQVLNDDDKVIIIFATLIGLQLHGISVTFTFQHHANSFHLSELIVVQQQAKMHLKWKMLLKCLHM